MMPRCGARSRVTFSNTWGAIVFVVLHLGRSGALFFDSPWPSVSSLEVLFFRFGAPALSFSIWGHCGGAHVGAPCRTMNIQKAFPCSVALVPFCAGAFPCSVALVY